MCLQRRQKNETYASSDLFYSAVVVLYERGLLHGYITRGYKRAKNRAKNPAWVTDGKKLAAKVGFCGREVTKEQLSHLHKLLSCTMGSPADEKLLNFDLPDGVCVGANIALSLRGSWHQLAHIMIAIATMWCQSPVCS